MKKAVIKPEGFLLSTEENKFYTQNLQNLTRAMELQKTLEARVKICDLERNLIVDLGEVKGIIPKEEALYSTSEKDNKDIAIITRVNKPVCFKIKDIISLPDGTATAILSRKQAQIEALDYIKNEFRIGEVIDCRVTHLEAFGAFVDIGCGIISLITIDSISVSRIPHPKERFYAGQKIKAIVKSVDKYTGRVYLSHKELLGTWEENAAEFHVGETVSGVIRSVESYGIFVELAPNFAGLSDIACDVHENQNAAVFIKSIIPDKMKVKLAIVDTFEDSNSLPENKYYIDSGIINHWVYSPENCDKIIETIFNMPE